MKVSDAIKKAKNKAKNKVAAKIGKVAKKTAKTTAALAGVALFMSMPGCITPGDMEQPARSQTMSNTFRDCVIIANARSVALNREAKTLDAEADTMSAPLEFWTQTQANDGSETVTPAATSTPSMTIDTDAALDVPLKKGGTSGGSAVDKLVSGAVDMFKGGSSDDGCEGGDCDIDGGCEGGDCERGGCEGGNCEIR